MKKGALAGLVCLAVGALAMPTAASAQGAWLGVGPTFPTGDYGDYANTGFMAVGGISFDLPSPGLSVFGEGFWGQNGHDVGDNKTNPFGVMGGLLYDMAGEGEAGLYLFGQAGLMVHKYSSDLEGDDSETGLGFGGGVGYGIPWRGKELFVEGRYMQGSFDYGDTGFFGIFVGIAFGLGGGG